MGKGAKEVEERERERGREREESGSEDLDDVHNSDDVNNDNQTESKQEKPKQLGNSCKMIVEQELYTVHKYNVPSNQI